jgi:predicted AAA+ superfamily ATPase
VPASEYAEWLESYWARDVQELFRLRQRGAFVRFLQLVLARSGGMFEATSFAEACAVSRTTIAGYLDVLEMTGVAQLVRPFSSRATTEIVSAPKVYGFDTGFVRFANDWRQRRPEDLGRLWEHYVLNELNARLDSLPVRYWRAKSGAEVDFVVLRGERPPAAIECTWSAGGASRAPGLRAFRARYPGDENYVVCADVERPYRTRASGVEITVTGLEGLVEGLGADLLP